MPTDEEDLAFREPTRTKYSHVTESGEFVVIVPVIGGLDFSTDNTCQSTKKLKAFLGLTEEANAEQSSARNELMHYRECLEYDLAVMKRFPDSRFESIQQAKARRLKQVTESLVVIQHLRDISKSDTTVFPEYPPSIQALLREKTNLFCLTFSPTRLDPYLRGSAAAIFSLSRIEPPAFSFSHHLRTIFQNNIPITRPLSLRIQDDFRTTQQIMELRGVTNFTTLLKIATDVFKGTYQKLTGLNPPPWLDNGIVPGCERKIREALFLTETGTEQTDLTLEDVFNALCNSLSDSLPEPDPAVFQCFSSEGAEEKLSLITQYFFGFVAVFCFENDLFTAPETNLGHLLDDQDDADCQMIPRIVLTAMEEKRPVEAALFEFINQRIFKFSLKRPLTKDEQGTILKRFSTCWNGIASADEKDELLVLSHRPGHFVSHGGAIGIPLPRLVPKLQLPSTVSADKSVLMQTNLTQLPTIIATVENIATRPRSLPTTAYTGENRAALIRWALDTPKTALQLLFSAPADPTRNFFFETLSDDEEVTVRQHRSWDEVKKLVLSLVPDRDVRIEFLSIFDKKPATATQVRLRYEDMRLLEVMVPHAADKVGSTNLKKFPPYLQSIAGIIERLIRTDCISAIESFHHHGVLFTAKTEADATQLKQILSRATPELKRTIHLRPASIRQLYHTVAEKYTKQKKELATFNQLDGQEKLQEACRLMSVRTRTIQFDPERGALIQTHDPSMLLILDQRWSLFYPFTGRDLRELQFAYAPSSSSDSTNIAINFVFLLTVIIVPSLVLTISSILLLIPGGVAFWPSALLLGNFSFAHFAIVLTGILFALGALAHTVLVSTLKPEPPGHHFKTARDITAALTLFLTLAAYQSTIIILLTTKLVLPTYLLSIGITLFPFALIVAGSILFTGLLAIGIFHAAQADSVRKRTIVLALTLSLFLSFSGFLATTLIVTSCELALPSLLLTAGMTVIPFAGIIAAGVFAIGMLTTLAVTFLKGRTPLPPPQQLALFQRPGFFDRLEQEPVVAPPTPTRAGQRPFQTERASSRNSDHSAEPTELRTHLGTS